MKVAAIIPVRNRAHVLGRAIKSAISQTHPLSEIVVIDDGSTDNSVEVARSFNDDRIKIIQQSHQGACAARNVGWRSTDADWIAFLDSDDIWVAAKIAAQVDAVRYDKQLVACFTGFLEIGNVGSYQFCPITQMISLLDLQKGNGLGPTSVSMVKRTALEQVGGWDEALLSAQDWDLWVKLRRLGTFVVIAAPMMHFEQGGKDRISKDFNALVSGHRVVFDRIARGTDWRHRRLVRALHAAHMSDIMEDLGRRRDALYFAAKSFFLRPNRYAISILLDRLASAPR